MGGRGLKTGRNVQTSFVDGPLLIFNVEKLAEFWRLLSKLKAVNQFSLSHIALSLIIFI